MASGKTDVEVTGDARRLLANALKGTINGDLDIERADKAWKIGKAINDSLYSETKIALFRHQIGERQIPLGELPLYPKSV